MVEKIFKTQLVAYQLTRSQVDREFMKTQTTWGKLIGRIFKRYRLSLERKLMRNILK